MRVIPALCPVLVAVRTLSLKGGESGVERLCRRFCRNRHRRISPAETSRVQNQPNTVWKGIKLVLHSPKGCNLSVKLPRGRWDGVVGLRGLKRAVCRAL
jgi:hypothetical protein